MALGAARLVSTLQENLSAKSHLSRPWPLSDAAGEATRSGENHVSMIWQDQLSPMLNKVPEVTLIFWTIKEHDPDPKGRVSAKCVAVFRKDHAQSRT
jgi:hypothetical protein